MLSRIFTLSCSLLTRRTAACQSFSFGKGAYLLGAHLSVAVRGGSGGSRWRRSGSDSRRADGCQLSAAAELPVTKRSVAQNASQTSHAFGKYGRLLEHHLLEGAEGAADKGAPSEGRFQGSTAAVGRAAAAAAGGAAAAAAGAAEPALPVFQLPSFA